jgi:hypothetical protein
VSSGCRLFETALLPDNPTKPQADCECDNTNGQRFMAGEDCHSRVHLGTQDPSREDGGARPQPGANAGRSEEARQRQLEGAGDRRPDRGESFYEFCDNQGPRAPAHEQCFGTRDTRTRIQGKLAEAREDAIAKGAARHVPKQIREDGREYGGREQLSRLTEGHRQAACSKKRRHGRHREPQLLKQYVREHNPPRHCLVAGAGQGGEQAGQAASLALTLGKSMSVCATLLT